ncbi:ATP-binding protein [Promicromonospora sp. NPDC059942]|uniref:ATP-binding protein n=1 Tax=Promicromonospora sp. NPDC059942 TaxID=3347009 RepID=UPI003649A2B3
MEVDVLPVVAGAEARAVSGTALRLQLLGPLRIWRGGVELDTGPRQQANLLALLLAHDGAPVGQGELVDLIWGDRAPSSAVNVVHKYVSALRRLLEPGLARRGESSFLLRRGDGYLWRSGDATLDLATFRALVDAGRGARDQGRHDEAFDRYARALRLWQGPAGDGLTYGPEAAPVFGGLDREFLDACTAAADVAVSHGRPELLVPALRLAASTAPLDEPVQAALMTTLAAAGRQAEALSVFQTVRARLAGELGIRPGRVLETAHHRVLRQDVAPAAPGTATPRAGGAAPDGAAPDLAPPPASTLVGRSAELAVLRAALDGARAGGTALVLVEGEPGAGKSRLLEEAVTRAGHDALVVRGRCTDGEGAPPLWPWVQVVRTILDTLDAPERERRLAAGLGPLLDPHDDAPTGQVLSGGSGQFRLFEHVVALVAHAAARRPVALVVDDLHWADTASLRLFGHLAARQPAGVVLLGALRDRAPVPGTELARALAGLSRSSGYRRLRLGPLGVHEVVELLRAETGQDPDPAAARALHARAAGNPFFVQELARSVAGAGRLDADAAARSGIPSTVRDVVRDRLAGLDDHARHVLELAALIGREVDLNLLARAAGLDATTCLARLEPAEDLGLVAPAPGDPCAVRFAHDLVRESVCEMTASRRAARLHLRVADALEHAPDGESVPERVAHHLWSAGPLAEPARTAAALVRSGRRAAGRSALEAAEQHLRPAVRVARAAGLAEVELAALAELTAVIGMRSMFAGAELQLLERAEHLARSLGREVEAAGILYSRWAAHVEGIDLEQCGPLAVRLREQAERSQHPTIRTYGLQAWGIHQYHVGNIGEGFRYLSRSQQTLLADDAGAPTDPVRAGLQLLLTGMLAETTALHGDLAGARALLDQLEPVDDRYTVTAWSTWSTRIAAMAGDPGWALSAAERGIAVDPELSYAFLGTYQRLARCWGRAVTGDDPAGAADEAQHIIETNLVDPVRSCVSTWYGLLGEMRLASGQLRLAAVALDRAEHLLDAHGQRYAEGMILLLRARLLHAQGRPAATVREAARHARGVSAEREAHLFVRRADEFLAWLGPTASSD